MAERASLQEILEELLRATDASRTTLRLDLPDQDSGLDAVVAEALAPGARDWSSEDVAALKEAVERVRRALDATVQANRETDDGELEEPQDPDP